MSEQIEIWRTQKGVEAGDYLIKPDDTTKFVKETEYRAERAARRFWQRKAELLQLCVDEIDEIIRRRFDQMEK